MTCSSAGPGVPSTSSVVSSEYLPYPTPPILPPCPAAGEGPDCQNGREVKIALAQKSGFLASHLGSAQ